MIALYIVLAALAALILVIVIRTLQFKPEVEVYTCDQILPMVRNNLGIGFVPSEFLGDENSDNVLELQLKEQLPPRSICFLKRKDHTLGIAAKQLEKMIINAAEN